MCSLSGRAGLKKNVKAQQNLFLHKCKRGEHVIQVTTATSFEMKIIVSLPLLPLQKKHIVTQKLLYTHKHIQYSCFDENRQRGSLTGSLGATVVLEERMLMIKDDSI